LSESQISSIIKDVLINHFDILPDEFKWDIPLDKLNSDFAILGYLVDLEQLLFRELKINISLHQHIEPSFHTPEDIITLVKELITRPL